ncbi:dTDP-4-dehydrorhamnose 3,5-epimerase family protein [Aeromonas veronii]|uniref:dTDP-4-dehydrorhamnose 3,5-epimerase family protein n=1 Tax=Aeromonas veronii TaxID=654 RepID=UPI001F425311|nr:dTDP-4-dehydrorhamnose 3,5-epimerase family protein [Aeromonas veronii]
MWVPPGSAHGFYVADVFYKCTGYYQQGDKVCIRWDSPADNTLASVVTLFI